MLQSRAMSNPRSAPFLRQFFLAIVSHRRLVSSLLRSTSSCLRAVSLALSLSLSQVSGAAVVCDSTWGPSYPLCAPGLELAQHLWQENDAHNRIDRIKELIRGQRVLDTGSPVTVRTKNARDFFLIVDCGFHFCDGTIRSGEMLI